MDNEMMYKLFLNTISKMDDEELKKSLIKAKQVLSEKDFESLVNLIDKEKNNH